MWYDGRCGSFKNFESARHFRIESSDSLLNLESSQVPTLNLPLLSNKFNTLPLVKYTYTEYLRGQVFCQLQFFFKTVNSLYQCSKPTQLMREEKNTGSALCKNMPKTESIGSSDVAANLEFLIELYNLVPDNCVYRRFVGI